MTDEAKVFATTGFGGGMSVGVRADSAEEFLALVAGLRQLAAGDPVLAGLFAPVIGVVNQGQPMFQQNAPVVDEAQAMMTVQQAFPGAQVVSTVGQPLPQPTYVAAAPPAAAPVATAPVAPPGVPYPGNCPHGVRVYNGKPARGKAWRRWECATPWKPGMTKAERDARCEAINVEN